MAAQTDITRADIMDMAAYEKIRLQRRAEIAEIKRHRRLGVGPDATFYFECYDTMWYQIHEMLRIEKGGDAQIDDELAAFNPLVPKGRELVATLMFEIDEPDRRDALLSGLGGVENTITLELAGEIIKAAPEGDVERTSDAGKASSVQFVHFPFTEAATAAFKQADQRITLGIGHEKYRHMAVLSETMRAALAKDFAN